jgi:hypothetical protein
VTAWKSEQMTITGTRWVFGPFAGIIYSGRYGTPDQPAGAGQITLQRRLTQVTENCSDRSQFVRTCIDSVRPSRSPLGLGSFPRTRRVRFGIDYYLISGAYLKCRATEANPPGFYFELEDEPSLLVPITAFYPARPRFAFPQRRFASTGAEIDPETRAPYTVQGTVTYSLRFGLRRYVEPRAPCRDRRPQRRFVCLHRPDNRHPVGLT